MNTDNITGYTYAFIGKNYSKRKIEVLIMDSNKAWNNFTKTGSVESYLIYRMYSKMDQGGIDRGQFDEIVNKRVNSQGEQLQ